MGPVKQYHSPHLHVRAPGIFSDLLSSVQILKREWGMESNGKLPHLFILVKLQLWCLSLRWKTCHRQNCTLGSCVCSEGHALGQNTLMIFEGSRRRTSVVFPLERLKVYKLNLSPCIVFYFTIHNIGTSSFFPCSILAS